MLQESALAPREPELTENAVSSPSPSMLRLILRERSFHRINAQPATTYRGGAAVTNRNFTILRSWFFMVVVEILSSFWATSRWRGLCSSDR